jgi:hypothetical protein
MTCNSISIRDKRTGEFIMNGDFQHTIQQDVSAWYIEDRVKVCLSLEKDNENIWTTIIKGHKQIDGTKVANTKPLTDFDQETQVRLQTANP